VPPAMIAVLSGRSSADSRSMMARLKLMRSNPKC
jgi:hypothetical protein